MSTLDELETALEKATPGPWKSRPGYGPDRFAPEGYRYVQFGRSEKAADGHGTDQLRPGDADLIAAARNALPALLRVARAAEVLAVQQNDPFYRGDYTAEIDAILAAAADLEPRP